MGAGALATAGTASAAASMPAVASPASQFHALEICHLLPVPNVSVPVIACQNTACSAGSSTARSDSGGTAKHQWFAHDV